MLHILPLMAMILSGQSKDTNHILSRPQITNISAKSFKKRFLKAIYHIYIYPPIQAICIVCWTKISRIVKSSGATEFIFSLLLNAFANAPEQSNKDGKLSFCTTSCIWRERARIESRNLFVQKRILYSACQGREGDRQVWHMCQGTAMKVLK